MPDLLSPGSPLRLARNVGYLESVRADGADTGDAGALPDASHPVVYLESVGADGAYAGDAGTLMLPIPVLYLESVRADGADAGACLMLPIS